MWRVILGHIQPIFNSDYICTAIFVNGFQKPTWFKIQCNYQPSSGDTAYICELPWLNELNKELNNTAVFSISKYFNNSFCIRGLPYGNKTCLFPVPYALYLFNTCNMIKLKTLKFANEIYPFVDRYFMHEDIQLGFLLDDQCFILYPLLSPELAFLVDKKWKIKECKSVMTHVLCQEGVYDIDKNILSDNAYFKCNDGTYILKAHVCDGINDCSYSEDEIIQDCKFICQNISGNWLDRDYCLI